MGLFRRRHRAALTADGSSSPGSPVAVALAALTAARLAGIPPTRDAAMRLSVVNRSRDLICGTISRLPLARVDDGTGRVLEAGWLARPDPEHTYGWLAAWVTDDLLFYERAYLWVTARDGDGLPLAVRWLPFVECQPVYGDDLELEAVTWWPRPRGATGTPLPAPRVLRRDALIVFESPVTGILRSGLDVLTTAMRLDLAAERFAGAEVPAGWLKQTAGDPLTEQAMDAAVASWNAKRASNITAFLNPSIDYQESTLDPSRLQLVQGRAFQDAAVARVCNVPNFTVGVAVPGDSLTYKTALTARLDLIDWGIGPYLACWEQTLSADDVMPPGQSVTHDLEPFVRTAQLSGVDVPAFPQPAASSSSSTAPADQEENA